MAKIGVLTAEIDSTKIIADTPDELVVPALLAREGVLKYPQGMAYRPADELERSAFTFDGAWITAGKHPEHMILTNPKQISGRISNIFFDQNVKGVRGHVHIDKRKAEPQFVADIKSGALKDVSIGFLYEEDWKGGIWNGEKYDYVQRNMLINHVAVGVPVGRMTSPSIGISVDSAMENAGTVRAAADPWEDTEDYIRSGHGDASLASTCRTTDFDGKLPQGMKAIYCKNKNTGDWYIQSYLFPKSEGWTMTKAKTWFNAHNDALTKAEETFRKVTNDAAQNPPATPPSPPSSGQTPPAGTGQAPPQNPPSSPPQTPPAQTPPAQTPPKPPTVDDIIAANKKAVAEAQKSLENR
jgi:hypothetical protein